MVHAYCRLGEKMKEGTLKQIIIITDGKSNRGISPIESAKIAASMGITVSTIGILDRLSETELEFEEIKNIAAAGNGMYDLSYIENLGHTLHMLTQKTVNKTIGQVVNTQLKELIGEDITSIEPSRRSGYIDFIESFSNEVNLKMCILLDCSSSMKNKLKQALESLDNLVISLDSRKGQTQVAVVGFPGKYRDETTILSGFDDPVGSISSKVKDIRVNGVTPTGPAIEFAIKHINGEKDSPVSNEGLFTENIV